MHNPHDVPVSYEWDASVLESSCHGNLEIEPRNGVLEAGSQTVVLMEYQSSCENEIFKSEILLNMFPFEPSEMKNESHNDEEVIAIDPTPHPPK